MFDRVVFHSSSCRFASKSSALSTPRKLFRFLISTIGVAIFRSAVFNDVQIDVRIHAETALLHVAVGNAQVTQNQFQFGQETPWLHGRCSCRGGSRFPAMACRFDSGQFLIGRRRPFIVKALAGIFFQVGPLNPDVLGLKFASTSEIRKLPSPQIGLSNWLI